jgi:hypothetical protein
MEIRSQQMSITGELPLLERIRGNFRHQPKSISCHMSFGKPPQILTESPTIERTGRASVLTGLDDPYWATDFGFPGRKKEGKVFFFLFFVYLI